MQSRTRTERAAALANSPAPWLALALVLLVAAVLALAPRRLVDTDPLTRAVAAVTGGALDQRPAALRGELPYFGFNELRWATSWQLGEAAEPDRAMRQAIDAAAHAGANTSRLPVPWLDVVDAAGGWDENAWARYRDAYERMIAVGIRPVIVLYAAPRQLGEYDPAWAPPGCDGGLVSPPDRAYDAEWQAYVLRASVEFGRALALQIWNEPNSRDYWGGPGCAPDPARYVELVALAREALAGAGSAHPQRRLVTAGLNPATVPGSIDWRQYLEATISAGVLEYAQVVGIHPYPLRGDCELGADPALAMARSAERQLAEAAAIVPEPTRLWATEFGDSSAAGMTTDCRALSETDQARALGATYDALAASPRVELAIVHQLVDETSSYPEQLPNRFGVTRDAPAFLSPKQAYWCLAGRRAPAIDPGAACE